ncbi:MAG: TonB-dependent receptor [Melioribacteraceae bacterium]|nr:TonB-dependent receptor [Melioribacteraceae bacterium]
MTSKFKTLKMVLLLFLLPQILMFAQRSRIIGTVVDSKGEPIFGANVVVLDSFLGGATDEEGQFFIVNVPVGTYNVRASAIGYTQKTIQNVLVSADRTTQLEFTLVETSIQSEEIVVTAERDVLHKEVSNTQIVATNEQITNAAGIREINAFLQKMPGVSESDGYLTIRGGTADQVGSMVNGLSYNNLAVGNAETSVPLSAIEQVSLLSGGYNAEYGNFRSGLINITTKSGTKDGYHGTINVSRDQEHMRRFGPRLSDPHNPILVSYLDADVAFAGTKEVWADDEYKQNQHPIFMGWNKAAENYNRLKLPEEMVTPFDLYLLGAWMFMAEPDYEGLAELGYVVSEEHRRLFEERIREEDGYDINIDAGFGGPVPLIGKYLGDATFYLSNKSTERHYIMPVSRDKDKNYTTMLTVKSNPLTSLSVTFNGLWKRQLGASAIRPPWGDSPSVNGRGGFMNVNNVKYWSDDVTYFFDPPFFPEIDQTTVMGGVTINHVLSNSTFYELTLSALSIQNGSNTGDSRDTTEITKFGPIPVDEMPFGKWQYAPDHTVSGYKFPSYDGLPGIAEYRFRGKEGDLYDNSNITQYRAKFDIASQLNEHHYIKAGIEYNLIDIDHHLWQKWNNNAYNTYEFNYHRKPSQTGFYLQDQISFEGIVANLGVRMDYYYGGGGKWPTGDPFAIEAFRNRRNEVDTSLYSYLAAGGSWIWDLWNEYDKENPGFLEPIKNWFTISPRLGISFPITDRSKFYFNYGHFRSNPPYYSMYLFRYRYDKNGLYDMANPNLEPPKTISYELGTAYNFYDSYILKLSGYYKDVTGQNGEVNYQNQTGQVDYDRWENNEYEDIQGLEINISKNDNSWITGWINFNYMLRKNGLTGRETITDVTVNNDKEGLYDGQESRFLPRPQMNANITFRSPSHWGPAIFDDHLLGNWNLTFFFEWQAGSYFTWNPLDKLHYSNNLQYPDYYMLDMKLSKTFTIGGFQTTFFVDVSNLLNLKVSLLNREYAFKDDQDRDNYYASLRLPMYDSPEFDQLRELKPGQYISGNDEVGDLRSKDKPYIDDPNYSFWLYGQPRDIWFGLRVDF